jgi:DNA-binding response OmpR family regulator
LRLAEEFTPHLILLDLRMPGMTGQELAQKLRANGGASAAIPKLIAMSASVLSFNRDDALSAGCDDFLPKPFREAELLAQLAKHLELRWTYDASPSPTAAATPESTLDAATLERLLASAKRGEVNRLRELLGQLRDTHPGFVAETESLLNAYRMDELRVDLEKRLLVTS